MANLTTADQQLLRETGQWARERCDRAGCNNIIGYLAWKGRRGDVFCSRACLVAHGDAGELPAKRKRRGESGVVEEASVAGSNGSICKFLVKLFQKDPKKVWARVAVVQEGKRAKLGLRKEIRAEIRLLQREGFLEAEGRSALRLSAKPRAKPSPVTQADPGREKRSEVLGSRERAGKRIRVSDAPVMED